MVNNTKNARMLVLKLETQSGKWLTESQRSECVSCEEDILRGAVTFSNR